MPVMGGLEETERIRGMERETGAHIPIIAMTAHAMTGDREKCLVAGMDDYVPHPIDVEVLQETLQKWTEKIVRQRREGLLPPRSRSEQSPVPEASSQIESEDMAKSSTTAPVPTAKRQPCAEDAPDADPVDLARLRALAEGDKAILERLINLFLDDAEQHSRLLEEAIKSNDAKAVETEAHRIKGGAGQVGAAELQEIAAALEGMGRESRLDGAEETFSDFEREYERVSGYLREETQT